MKDHNICGNLETAEQGSFHKIREGMDELVKYQLLLVEKIDKRMGTDQLGVLVRGSDKERILLAYELLSCIHNETEEVRDWLPWKSWKSYKDFDLQKVLPEIKMEIVDLFHFVTELMMCFDMTSEDLAKMYAAKHQENLNRQDRNY